MRASAWIAIGLAALAAAGCATRTQAPVADRQRSAPPSASQELAKPGDARAGTYTVRPGDTLYSIAVGNGMDPRELAALNNITDPSKISVGQVLQLRPAPAAPVVETGTVTVSPVTGTAPIEARPLGAVMGPAPGAPTTGAAAPTATAPSAATPSGPTPSAATPGAPAPSAARAPSPVIPGLKTGPKVAKLPYSEQNLARLQREEGARAAAQPPPQAAPPQASPTPAPAPKAPAATGEDAIDWGWPATGRVMAAFQENGNKGLAIGGKVGDPVYASAAGSVVYSGEGLASYGKLIIVKHNDKYLSVYAHNSAILVKEKQSVAKGQKIAEIGTTGAGGDRPRLHFEIRRFGKPVDPQQFLPNRP
jgi:lipoprotein NlpD